MRHVQLLKNVRHSFGETWITMLAYYCSWTSPLHGKLPGYRVFQDFSKLNTCTTVCTRRCSSPLLQAGIRTPGNEATAKYNPCTGWVSLCWSSKIQLLHQRQTLCKYGFLSYTYSNSSEIHFFGAKTFLRAEKARKVFQEHNSPTKIFSKKSLICTKIGTIIILREDFWREIYSMAKGRINK